MLKEILDKKELNLPEEILTLDNQNKFQTDSQSFRNLKNDLNIIKENNIFQFKGRLENAPIPNEAKLPILIYREHYLSKIIIWDRKFTENWNTQVLNKHYLSWDKNIGFANHEIMFVISSESVWSVVNCIAILTITPKRHH